MRDMEFFKPWAVMVVALGLVTGLAACGEIIVRIESPSATEEHFGLSPDPAAPSSTEGATPSALPPSDYSCNSPFYMVWASHELETLSKEIQESLGAAGVGGAQATASAYGEDWVEYDPATRDVVTVCNFSVMQTDFSVQLEVNDLEDREALGVQLAAVLAVLDEFPPEATPGSQPGQIEIVYTADGEENRMWFSVAEAKEARRSGMQGADLLEALGFTPASADASPSDTFCNEYLGLFVSLDGVDKQAVATCYRCYNAHIDSTGQAPPASPALVIPPGKPLLFRLGAESQPDRVEARLYPRPGLSASFFHWPEELPEGIEPVEQFQPEALSSFEIWPEAPHGEYSVVIRVVWEDAVEVFFALSIRLE